MKKTLCLLLQLLVFAMNCLAQDNTQTKNNPAEIYDNLYEIYTMAKKHRADSACLQLSDSMRTLAIAQGDKRAIAMSYALPLSYYMNLNGEKKLNEYVGLMMKASEEAELWSFYYHALTQKSVFLLRQNRVAETLALAEETMKKAYADNNQNGIYASHTILINAYMKMDLYNKALKEAQKAIEVEKDLPDTEFGNTLSKIAEICFKTGRYQEGLDMLDKYGPLVNNTGSKVRYYEYKALFYYLLGNKEAFRKTYDEVNKMYKAYGYSAGSVKNALRTYYFLETGRTSEALAQANNCKSSTKRTYLPRFYRDAHQIDSLFALFNASNEYWRETHEQLYEADLKKYSLELDNQNLKLKQEEILHNQREARGTAIIILFMVLLFFGGILYWREQHSRRKLQKAYTKLSHQKIEIEKQLKAVKEANKASDAKTSFLFNMSHDIRTPMNAILGFSELLEQQKDNPERVTDYLNKIKSSGKFLLSLINNVLDMARIESGKMELDEEFYDLLDFKNNAVALFEDMAMRKHITLTHDSPQLKHRYVMIDQMKVRQIVLNLLSNAIKYTPDGGSVHYTFEEVPCQREGYATYVSTVKDNGIGMSAEFAKTIFDMFSRERNTTESKQVGTGLGMSIVKRLVDMMGGTIELETEPGKGTTFIVTLSHPIVENPEQYLKKELPHEEMVQQANLEGKRILLAEDNDLNAEIAIAILEGVGFKIDHAEDGVQCVKMLSDAEAGYYDAILMDVQMPNMNGYETTKRIRSMSDKAKAAIPIIAMTANAFDEDKKKALDAGMNGHLAKPIDMDELMKVLTAHLADSMRR